MSIRRAPRPETRFYTLDKSISEDSRLSWGARGLLIFLLGKPDHWEVSVAHLIKQTENSAKRAGRDAIRVILKELERIGYLQVDKARNESGKFGGMAYTVCETPITPETENPAPVEPEPILPAPDYPAPDNPPLVRTDFEVSTENTTKSSPNGSQGEFVNSVHAAQSGSSSKSKVLASNDNGQSSPATLTDASSNPVSQASRSGADDAVASDPKKTGKAKATKGSGVDIGMLNVPDWLPTERVEAFIEYRKSIKKPMAQLAADLLIRELIKIRNAGHDAVLALENAILSGWLKPYAPKESQTFPGNKKFDPRAHVNGSRKGSEGHAEHASYIDVAAVRVD